MLWPQEEQINNDSAEDAPDHWLQVTMQYMRDNYIHEIKLEKLAELAGMHPSYYSQLFKSRMYKNPIEYVTHLRMNRAKELLMTSDMRVRDVARSVGYRDEFYFSRRFRNHAGYAPTSYAKQVHRNIVSLSYPYTDHLMTLGITPCAAQIQGHLPHIPNSLSLPFHAYEPWEQGRQAFLDVKPDLILTKDNAAAKAMEHIGDIAPIITIPGIRPTCSVIFIRLHPSWIAPRQQMTGWNGTNARLSVHVKDQGFDWTGNGCGVHINCEGAAYVQHP